MNKRILGFFLILILALGEISLTVYAAYGEDSYDNGSSYDDSGSYDDGGSYDDSGSSDDDGELDPNAGYDDSGELDPDGGYDDNDDDDDDNGDIQYESKGEYYFGDDYTPAERVEVSDEDKLREYISHDDIIIVLKDSIEVDCGYDREVDDSLKFTGKNVIIDLNGKDLWFSGNCSNIKITVNDNNYEGAVVIRDSSSKKTGEIWSCGDEQQSEDYPHVPVTVKEGGIFVIESGTLKGTVDNYGIFAMYGGTLCITRNSDPIIHNHLDPWEHIDSVLMLADGGTVQTDGYGVVNEGVITSRTYSHTVFNCTVSNTITSAYVDGVNKTYRGTISGGIFKGEVRNLGYIDGGGSFRGKVVNETRTTGMGPYTGTISGGTFRGEVENTGTISGGIFKKQVTNSGNITEGTFWCKVENTGTISNGGFDRPVTNSGKITGGTFWGKVTNTGTITGGNFLNGSGICCVNFIWNDGASTKTIYIASGTVLTQSYIPAQAEVGYVYKWYKSSNYTNAYDLSKGVTENITLYGRSEVCDHKASTIHSNCTEPVTCSVCGGEIPIDPDAHQLEWKNDGRQYWSLCTRDGCTYQSTKKIIPTVTVTGADKVCKEKAYAVTAILSDSTVELTASYTSGSKSGKLTLDSVSRGYTGTITSDCYDASADSFTVTVNVKTADGYEFPVSKTVQLGHTGTEKWYSAGAATHEKKWSCCGTATGETGDHSWKDGKCTICEYQCQHPDAEDDGDCTTAIVCLTCRETVKAANDAHTWGTWQSNGDGTHSRKCAVCTIEEMGKCSGGTASCWEKAICTKCCAQYGDYKHSGKEVWVTTETTHMKKWNCCGTVIAKSADHSWENGTCKECGYECAHSDAEDDGDCTTAIVCPVCGETLTAANKTHSWGNWKSNSDGTHTRKCTVDGCTKEETGKCSGGTATCTEKAKCEKCGKEYGDYSHSGKEKWVTTETTHEKIWSCCGTVIEKSEDHSWENGICKVCKYECAQGGVRNDDVSKDRANETAAEPNNSTNGSVVKADNTASGKANSSIVKPDATVSNDTNESAAETGDESALILWMAAAFVCGSGIMALLHLFLRKRCDSDLKMF